MTRRAAMVGLPVIGEKRGRNLGIDPLAHRYPTRISLHGRASGSAAPPSRGSQRIADGKPQCYTNIDAVLYTHPMKRLQIMIEEDVDAELERAALEARTSKAALIRLFVRERLRPLPPLSADPIGRMAGADDFEPATIDDVVYR